MKGMNIQYKRFMTIASHHRHLGENKTPELRGISIFGEHLFVFHSYLVFTLRMYVF